jgi:hypothetical protein
MQIGDPFIGLGCTQEKGGHLKIYSLQQLACKTLPLPRTASVATTSSWRLGATRCHLPRWRIRRCPPEALRYSLLLGDESSRRPLSPPSRMQRPVASEEPRSPTTVPLSPPTSHLTGMLSRGKRWRTGRRASPPRGGTDPGSVSANGISAERHTSRQPRTTCHGCDNPPRKIPYYRLNQSTLVIKR